MSLVFDGTGDYIDTGAALKAFGALLGSDWALYTWLNCSSSANSTSVMSSVNDGDSVILQLRMDGTGHIFGRIRDDDGNLSNVVTGGIITDSAWHFALLQRVGNTLEIYTNLTAGGTDDVTAVDNLVALDYIMPIGAYNDRGNLNSVAKFIGTIGEFAFYTRSFNASERKILYESRGTHIFTDSLEAHWLFNDKPEGTTAAGANSVIDISGNGHDGTPNGDPVYQAGILRPVRAIVS